MSYSSAEVYRKLNRSYFNILSVFALKVITFRKISFKQPWNGILLVKLNSIRAVYARENKPRLTLAAVYIERELGHLYECGLHETRNVRIKLRGPMMM